MQNAKCKMQNYGRGKISNSIQLHSAKKKRYNFYVADYNVFINQSEVLLQIAVRMAIISLISSSVLSNSFKVKKSVLYNSFNQ